MSGYSALPFLLAVVTLGLTARGNTAQPRLLSIALRQSDQLDDTLWYLGN